MAASPYRKKLTRLIQHVRRSVNEGVAITQSDEDLKQEFLRYCDRLELKMLNESKTESTTLVI